MHIDSAQGWHIESTVRLKRAGVQEGDPWLEERPYSLAWGNVIPVNEVDSVSVYISQPVPCR